MSCHQTKCGKCKGAFRACQLKGGLCPTCYAEAIKKK